MKKIKKIVSMIIIFCVLSAAFMCAMIFMGVVNLPQEENQSTVEKSEETEEWEIVFEGFEFRVKQKGLALIHESGCLNIRSRDEYLVQIDVVDKDIDEFWDNRDTKVKDLEEAGYEVILEPRKITVDGTEYGVYRITCENERGVEVDKTYYEILLKGVGKGKRILGIAKFDAIEMDSLDEEQRNEYYDIAITEVTGIVSKAKATDKKDDELGTGWEKREPIEPLKTDTISKDTTSVSYDLPEGYNLCVVNEFGKDYYSEEEKTDVAIAVQKYTSLTAKDMADSKSLAGISKDLSEGEYDVNGQKYYYYTYSVKRIEKDCDRYAYFFVAYTDLDSGDIYMVASFSEENEKVLNKEYFDTFLDIEETEIPETAEN